MSSHTGELYRRVDEVLYYVWDPIGVSDEPCARGEYRGYVPKILHLVETSDDIDPISAELREIVSTRMGLAADKERCDETARLLFRHKYAVKEGLA